MRNPKIKNRVSQSDIRTHLRTRIPRENSQDHTIPNTRPNTTRTSIPQYTTQPETALHIRTDPPTTRTPTPTPLLETHQKQMDIWSLLLRPHFRIDKGPKKPRYQDQKRTHTKLSIGIGGEVMQRDRIGQVKGNSKRGNREGGDG